MAVELSFPFVLGALLVVAQPLLDLACVHALQRLQYDQRAIDAARWTGSTAAFLPAAVLTAYGVVAVLLARSESADGGALLLWVVSLLILGFGFFLYAVTRSSPKTAFSFGPTETFRYTVLQLALVVLNVVGIIFAFCA